MAVGHKTAELENCWQVCAWSSIAGGSSVVRSGSGQVQVRCKRRVVGEVMKLYVFDKGKETGWSQLLSRVNFCQGHNSFASEKAAGHFLNSES